MKNIIAQLLLNIFLVALPVFGFSQGWERILSGIGQDELSDVVAHPDGGFLSVGYINAANRVFLAKSFSDGKLQWSKSLGIAANTSGHSLILDPAGDIFIAGFGDGFGANGRDMILIKTNGNGALIWQKNFGSVLEDEAFDLAQAPDGSIFMVGSRKQNAIDKDVLLVKTDNAGNLIWEKTFGTTQMDEAGASLNLLPNGGLAIVGTTKLGLDLDVLVIRVDADGNQIWINTFGFDIGGSFADVGNASVLAPDGKLVVAGYTNSIAGSAGLLMKIDLDTPVPLIFYKTHPDSGTTYEGLANTADGKFLVSGTFNAFTDTTVSANLNLLVSKLDADGIPIWNRNFGGGGPDQGNAVVEAADGGAVVAGSKQPYVSPFTTYAYLLKTDPSGVVFTNQIEGNVFHDFNNNCALQNNEPGLEDWIIKIEKAGSLDQYAVSDGGGFYKVLVDTGAYKVSLYRPNPYWVTCQPSYLATFSEFYDTILVDLPVKAAFACPEMQVDVVAPVLVRCAENTYTVSYCNRGTIAAVNAKIEFTLDPAMTFLGSSIPVLSVSNNVYTFDIGYVGVGFCQSFTVKTFLKCDVEAGETHCVTAHAFPDTFCHQAFPSWDGSIIQASGKCENDKIQLKLKNIGTQPTGSAIDYIVIEDVIMLTAPNDPNYSIALGINEEQTVFETDATGKTLRIITEQTAGYPGLSNPTAAVEGCVADTSAPVSLGFFTAFADDEAEPFKASDCQEVQDFYPNSVKIGHPKGVGVEHFVTDSTDLEYLIRFQNTGTDTVLSVEIRDTLSIWLDPTTVRAGAGSHPFDFEIYENGIVAFHIPTTNLFPNGSAPNDAASSGFVHFRVSQKPNTPCDTRIVNRAAIFLGNQNALVTNEVKHKICRDWLHFMSVETTNVDWPKAAVKVFPNPFLDFATVEISGVSAKIFELQMFDLNGKSIYYRQNSQATFRIERNQLPSGVLFYQIKADGRAVASGKILAD